MKVPIVNFLRYPGSKRRMLAFLCKFLPDAETITGRYIEPFVGGGSVFFSIKPKYAIISDINPNLIDLYRGIRYSPHKVWEKYHSFGLSKSVYHQVRDGEEPRLLTEKAARVLFLNRTCFKGMWRHNLKGKFNVGYGGQARRWVISEENLKEISRILRHAEIRCSDFEDVIDKSHEDDFIFVDPPYRPGEREQTNNHYIGRQFSFDDHSRLAKTLKRAHRRGVKWAMTTSSHPEIVSLFGNVFCLPIPQGTGRLPGIMAVNSGEILLANYPLKGVKQ